MSKQAHVIVDYKESKGLTAYADMSKRWWLGRFVKTTRAFINPETGKEISMGSRCQVLYKGRGNDWVSIGVAGLRVPLSDLAWWPGSDEGYINPNQWRNK